MSHAVLSGANDFLASETLGPFAGGIDVSDAIRSQGIYADLAGVNTELLPYRQQGSHYD
jgi:hypothetical protein